MKKLSTVILLALLLSVLTVGLALAQGMSGTIHMMEQNGSGQTGMASFQATADGKTMVTVDITPGAAGVAQPAHIHEGTCATLNPKPTYPLTNVVDGKSVTTINVSLADLTKGTYALNVHKSGPEASVYVSCGDLTAMAMASSGAPTGMPSTGAGWESLFLVGMAGLILSTIAGGILLRRRA